MKQKPKKTGRKNKLPRNGPASLFYCFAILLCCLSSFACRPVKSGTNLLPRPQPAYTAWLEQQSMGRQADKLIAQVSQSEKIWMFSGQGTSVDVLLKAAPQWLEISSATFAGKNFFHDLSGLIPSITQNELKGLYLGSLGEDQSWWSSVDAEKSARILPASLELDARLGEEREYERLAADAERAGLELGANLPAAHTSMGPDFFLQARNVFGHAGLYAMLEVPKNLWDNLPESSGEWDVHAISPLQLETFSRLGMLPSKLYRDDYLWGQPGGWAATGEVQGNDGKMRRWLYRYGQDPKFPVLLWQDPGGLAKKIFSAAIIQQTGFWRLPLTGLRLESLMGLEPQVPGDQVVPDAPQSYSPGLEALNTLSDQVHRYGGWALQADPLPLPLIELVLAGKCDFCREDETETLLLLALENGSVRELAQLYRHWLDIGLEQKRLARGFKAGDPPESGVRSEKARAGAQASTDFRIAAILGWRLGLPGLAFLSPRDCPGLEVRGKFPELDPGWKNDLKKILRMRAKSGLAQGRLVKVQEGSASLGVMSQLPEQGFWFLATNFGEEKERLAVNLPERCKRILDIASGKDLSHLLEEHGQKLVLPLDGYEVRHVILYMD